MSRQRQARRPNKYLREGRVEHRIRRNLFAYVILCYRCERWWTEAFTVRRFVRQIDFVCPICGYPGSEAAVECARPPGSRPGWLPPVYAVSIPVANLRTTDKTWARSGRPYQSNANLMEMIKHGSCD